MKKSKTLCYLDTPEVNKTHYEVGKTVRKTIQELGGTMPEELPTPEKSIKSIEKDLDEKNKLED